MQEKRIVPVAEHITDMLLARYKLPLPDRKPQQLNKSDKATFLPVLPPGLRAALDVAYHEMDIIRIVRMGIKRWDSLGTGSVTN